MSSEYAVDNKLNEGHNIFMTLSELLKPELLLIKAPCDSKDDLIAKLVEKICNSEKDFLQSQNDLLELIYKREHIGGTLLPSGLSVPHARLGNMEGFVFAMGTSSKPMFHEGLKLRLMVVMISSQTGVPYYLPTVAALTKLSRDGDYFSRLCDAEDSDEFIKILKEKDQVVG